MHKAVLLINPPSGSYIRDDRCQVPTRGLSSGLRAPLDLAYMAAVLEEKGYKCVIRDYPAENKTWDELKNDLEAGNYEMLVISVTTPTILMDLKACDIAKEVSSGIVTIAKGAHFSAEDADLIGRVKSLDIIIRGEYELAVGEIAEGRPFNQIKGITYRQNGRIQRNADRPFLIDMDMLPLPARHLLNNRLYTRPDTDEMMTSIQTTKGCPAQCIYCLVGKVSGRQIRMRSPDRIVEEMRVCKDEFGIENFYFRADTFTWNKEWMIEVCRKIVGSGINVNWVCNSRVDTIDAERIEWLKRAGCWMIGFGIESGDQGILNKMKKGTTLQQAEKAVDLCRKFSLSNYLFWVLGLPWETEETIKNTMRFARRIKGDFAEFHIAYPFPGTDFYHLGLENGLFSKDDLYAGDVKEGVVRSFGLSREKLCYYQRRMTREYYLSASRFLRLLRNIRSPKMLANYVYKGMSVLFNSRAR